MKDENIMCEMPPLSSRLNRSNSIPLLLQKINIIQNIKNKKPLIRQQSIDNLSPIRRNNQITTRKNSSNSGVFDFLDKKKFHDDLYININLNSAPSFNDNVYEIHRMIKEEKNKKIINFLNNAPFTEEYNNIDFNDIGIKQMLLQNANRNSKLKLFKRNNSCQDMLNPKIRIKKVTKRNENSILTSRLITNYTKALGKDSPKFRNINNLYLNNIKNNTSNISSATTNKSKFSIKFKEQKSNLNSNKIDEPTTTMNSNIILPKIQNLNSQNTNTSNKSETEKVSIDVPNNGQSFITSLSIEKMRFNINKLIVKKPKNKEKICEYEEKILKLKVYQIYQKEKLKELLNDEKFKIQEQIDYILKMYKIYEKIYSDFIDNIKKYINFLSRALYENEMESRLLYLKKKNINSELEIILDKLIDKQIQFENLINMRNFLFFVKNRDKKIIKLDDAYVYKVSNRNRFMNKIFNIFGRFEDSLAYKYLKRIIPISQLNRIVKPRAYKINGTIRRGYSIKYTQSTAENQKEDLLSPPPAGEKIFKSPEEFINILNYMTNNDIELMTEYEKIEINKEELNKVLDEEIDLNEKIEKDETHEYIKKNIKYLDEEKQKNLELVKKYENFYDLFSKKKELSSLQLNFKEYSFKAFNNIYFYNKIKYNKLRVKYKIEGLVLLEKLIFNVNNILETNKKIKIFPEKDIYHYIPEGILRHILSIKVEDFTKENQYIINDYTLQLLKLYEYFGEFITNKIEKLKNVDNYVYSKAKEEILNDRKIHNAKFSKKMMNEKRKDTLKELKEKWNKKIIRDSKKYEINIKTNLIKNLENKNNDKDLKSVDEEKEANDLLIFEEK